MNSATSSLGSIMGSQSDSGEMEKMLNDMVKDIGDITMTVLFDRENKAVYQIDYDMTEMMNKMMKSLMDSISKMSAEQGGEEAAQLSAMTMDVTEMKMVCNYSNFGSASDFEIPKEALEAKEMDLGSGE